MAQRRGDLHNISKMMIKKANDLDSMVASEIPEAFPLLPVSGGTDGEWAQYYDHAEYFGAQQKTELECSWRASDVLTKLLRELMYLQLIVGSLYPVEFQGSTHEIKIRDQFDKIKDWLDDGKAVIEHCQQIILSGIDSSLKPVVNRGNLRKLKTHIIRMGFEYVNEGKIPTHLSVERLAQSIAKDIEQQVDQKIGEFFKEQ